MLKRFTKKCFMKPKTSSLFSIPELMEQILLQLDTQTLLTSTRVCRLWNQLIKNSNKIQTALFFRPMPEQKAPGEPREINPLIMDTIWPQFFYNQLNTNTKPRGEKRPKLSKRKAKAFARPEASWRKMLLKQPPTSRICVVECEGRPSGPLYSYAKWDLDQSIRLGGLEGPISAGALTPSKSPFLVWAEAGKSIERLEKKYENEMETAFSNFFPKCDFIIFVNDGYMLSSLQPSYHWDNGSTRLDRWIESNNAPIHPCSKKLRMWSSERIREENRKLDEEQKEEEELMRKFWAVLTGPRSRARRELLLHCL